MFLSRVGSFGAFDHSWRAMRSHEWTMWIFVGSNLWHFGFVASISSSKYRYGIHNSKSSYQSLQPACVWKFEWPQKVKKNIELAPNSLTILLTNLNSLRTISNDLPVAALTNQTDTDQFVPWHTRLSRNIFGWILVHNSSF